MHVENHTLRGMLSKLNTADVSGHPSISSFFPSQSIASDKSMEDIVPVSSIHERRTGKNKRNEIAVAEAQDSLLKAT